MDLLLVAAVAAIAAWTFKTRSERARIVLLALHLRQFEIEKLMETLSEGYMRALGEEDAQRRQAIWSLLEPAERKVTEQLSQLAQGFASTNEENSWVLRPDWPTSAVLRLMSRSFPNLVRRHSFDLRRMLAVHALGVARAAEDTDKSPSAKAFTMLAELMLMQHTCHWYCKSKNIASARLLLRHQTSYQKVLDSVGAQTRREYLELVDA